MYYELYIDILFMVNFVMDYILLLIVRKMMRCSSSNVRVFLGALLGSGLTCVVMILPFPYAIIRFLLLYLLVNTVMIIVGLKISEIRIFIKAVFLLYIGGFLMGGIMGYVRQYIRVGSLFFCIAILGYYGVVGIWNFITYLQRMQQYICEVELHQGEHTYKVKGLIDTGNSLCDDITGRPVCIMDQHTIKEVLGVEMPIMRYIPYHTVGNAGGVMPLVKFDKMCVMRNQKEWIEKPIIAISEEHISQSKEYQMILNPNLF